MELGMPGEVAEKKIYDAAAKGDVTAFQEMLHQDPLLLDRVSYACSNKTPLHVATLQGNLAIVEEILNRNPQLAEELDFQNSSALHVASAKGYVEIADKLLSAAPDMCLSRDCQGRNPLHVAAMKGHVQVLEQLVRLAYVAAMEKLDRGQTVLHLCVKHDQLDSLKVLVPNLSELVSAKDDDGETILDLAVRYKQVEIIKYLARSPNMDKDSKNSKGKTPPAILEQSPNIDKDSKNSKGQTSLAILELGPPDATTSDVRKILRDKREILRSKFSTSNNSQSPPFEWLSKVRESLMVVAILIATMAFQAGVCPAGGVWQEDSEVLKSGKPLYEVGQAVMAYKDPTYYKHFIRCSTVAFVSSLSTILLLISGLPFTHRPVMWALLVVMWSSVTTIAATYAISVLAVTPEANLECLGEVTWIGIIVWGGVMGVLLVGNTLRLINPWLESKGVILWRPVEKFRKCVVQGKH